MSSKISTFQPGDPDCIDCESVVRRGGDPLCAPRGCGEAACGACSASCALAVDRMLAADTRVSRRQKGQLKDHRATHCTHRDHTH